jgi:hypothetical protein
VAGQRLPTRSYCSTGNLMLNFVPFFFSDSTSIVPPWSFTML